MISDELLEQMAVNAKYFATEENVKEIAQELIDARQKIDKWEKSVKKREAYITKLEWQVSNLKEDAERLFTRAGHVGDCAAYNASPDYCTCGYQDTIDNHIKVMKEVE